MALTDWAIKDAAQTHQQGIQAVRCAWPFLLVKPKGGSYGRLNYQSNGTYRTLAASTQEVRAREARDQQANARKLLRNRQDPAEVKQAQVRQSKRTLKAPWSVLLENGTAKRPLDSRSRRTDFKRFDERSMPVNRR